jgi:hypothetical protein
MARTAILAVVLIPLFSPVAPAQNWAAKMFDTTKHDFGTVARGGKEEFRFTLKNIYVQDVHIADVRTSCRCTVPRVENPSLKTYEEGAIVARLNTVSFRGKRSATITVTFDKPKRAQVQLQVSCYIRSDVVLNPGSAVFGSVEEGTGARKTIAVNYAGRNAWRILDVTSPNPHLSGQAIETQRGGGRVSYEVTVSLDKTAPAGYLREHLVLATNDANKKQVLVPVEAVINPGVTVSPNSLFMGVVRPGEKVTRQVVVRGKTPFRILSVQCEANRFNLETSCDSVPKPVHLIPVTFVAGEETGKVLDTIRIETDLANAAPRLSAYALVSP